MDFTDKTNGYLINDSYFLQSSIFRTKDGGGTWRKIERGRGFGDGPITTFKMINRDRGWLYSYDDSGNLKHFVVGDELTATMQYGVSTINAITFNNNMGWAVGGGGIILTREDREFGDLKPKATIQISTIPNPFHTQGADISINNLLSSRVKIHIIDILGREVAEIHDGFLTVGVHSFRFEPDGLSSGIYVIKAVADNNVAAQKCVFIRE